MMDTEEKLALSARPGKLTLIREGMFLKCYQQSLFSLVHSVYPDIKVTGRRIKKLGGQIVFSGGFPEGGLARVLPDARLTDWGAEADVGDIDEAVYQSWLTTLPLVGYHVGGDVPPDGQTGRLTLSDEDCHFLDSWQPGLFPPSVDTGFIQGLKARRKNINGQVA
ncbi:hypothetical protein [Enterobacter sp. SLBN-59]|uniref:hypothetical protein n=1 Tax=Enterobacter sp. SLBN-59 TaxID=2940621 RepID=UPI002168A16F|nr:hypothetical protein [Enterobacter sp. SLBN-59]MCS3491021.1 hypothetical protein [Enterobacter sp. SLBN-59]